MPTRSLAWRLTALLCAALFVAGIVRYAGSQLDDSFISFRYARNLVEGHGLVFNPGERVEGYTNLSFTLAAAAFLAVGLDPLDGAFLLTLGSAFAALLLSALLAGEALLFSWSDAVTSGRAALLAVCLLLATEGWAYWAVTGMETSLFAALLALGLLLLLKEGRTGRGHLSGVAFLCLALTRPEGAYASAVALGAAFLVEWRRHRDLREARRIVVTGAIPAAGVLAHLAWRWSYYGSLLPNTFHAKVTGGEGQLATGLAYLRDWALASPVAALSLMAPVILIFPGARARLGRGNPLWILWAVTAALAAGAVLVGGDSMPFFRFLAHLLPVACVVLVLAAESAVPGLFHWRGLKGLAAPLLLLITAVASHATEQPYRAFVAHRTAVVGSAVGAWFGRTLPPGSLMAVNTIGALPWASRLPTLDMLGLTDPVIARRPVYVSSEGWAGHRRGWGAYVLSRRPAAILWYNSAGSADPFYLGDRELADTPWFRFFYRHRVQRLDRDGTSLGPPAGGRADSSRGSAAGDHRTEASGEANASGLDGGPSAKEDEEGRPAPGGPASVRPEPGTGPVIARFLGRPFGFHDSGSMVAPELGIRAELTGGSCP